jgi:hypothetical protein
MHLLAVNIWTWLRFVIAKNAALDRPLDHPASAAFVGQNVNRGKMGNGKLLFKLHIKRERSHIAK